MLVWRFWTISFCWVNKRSLKVNSTKDCCGVLVNSINFDFLVILSSIAKLIGSYFTSITESESFSLNFTEIFSTSLIFVSWEFWLSTIELLCSVSKFWTEIFSFKLIKFVWSFSAATKLSTAAKLSTATKLSTAAKATFDENKNNVKTKTRILIFKF